MRATLDDAGAVLATAAYDPWGTPQDELAGPFGFTGELHHGDQVYLRARWYAPGSGTFPTRDPFAGWAETPYSLHAYQYAYRAPTVWTDPSGEVIGDACTPPYAWHAEEKVCVLRSDVPPWLRFLPEKRDPTFAIPAPMLVGSAPGAVGQLGGRPLGHLGREGLEACTNLIGGTLVWMLTQTHVETQTRTAQRENVMRVQLQEGFIHTFGIPLTASSDRGVTTRQVRDAMATLFALAQTDSITWFPHTHTVFAYWLQTSIIQLSQDLKRYPPGGISGHHISFLSEQIHHDRRNFRVDIDNLVGHNLRE